MKSMLGPVGPGYIGPGCVGLVLAAMLALGGCADDEVADNAAARSGGNGVCLPATQIDHTDILTDDAIVFYMKSGKPYLNKLTFACPSLKMEDGFAFVADFSEICSNSQTIRVLRSGNFCELGQFTPYDPAAKPAPKS